MNTPTPETDAAIIASNGSWTLELMDAMRKLERERDEYQLEIKAMRKAIQETHSNLDQIPQAYDARFFRAGKWAKDIQAKLTPFFVF